ncbi:hypothetical protein C8R44DRAFT_981518 [Mycena epipterygia]|nr:hypothetical protein C8R44DRAFT_981518 [Mycena epipterygia]
MSPKHVHFSDDELYEVDTSDTIDTRDRSRSSGKVPGAGGHAKDEGGLGGPGFGTLTTMKEILTVNTNFHGAGGTGTKNVGVISQRLWDGEIPNGLPNLTLAQFCQDYHLSNRIRLALKETHGFETTEELFDVLENVLENKGMKIGQISELKGALRKFVADNQHLQKRMAVTPNWIVDYEDGGWGNSQGQYYWEQNVSYTATDNRQHKLEVEFSMGINVKEPSKGVLPETSFIIQNQTMLWMRHKLLKAQGYGMIVLTSSYIPDITIETELSIKEPQIVELMGNSLPVTEKTKVEDPVRMALSIGVAPAMEKLSWGQSLLKKLTVKSAAPAEGAPDFRVSKLPLDDFKARGWDAKTERWRMPAYPSWGNILKQITKDPKDNLPESKGKQRDIGPATSEGTENQEGGVETATDDEMLWEMNFSPTPQT